MWIAGEWGCRLGEIAVTFSTQPPIYMGVGHYDTDQR